MRNTRNTPSAPSTDFRLRHVVSEYRAAWDAGEQPKLEEFLARHPDAEQSSMLRELLAIEIHALRGSGEEPSYDEYVRRFPSHLAIVDAHFLPDDSFKVSAETTVTCTYVPAEQESGSERRVSRLPDRYQFLERLGQGGFGEVWWARDQLLDRDVAIKGPRRDHSYSPQALDLFVEEARRASQLHQLCQRVVNVIDVVDEQGFCFIVMELMKGGSLASRMKKETIEPVEAAGIVAAIAETLTTIHQQNFVHRDIKPENILFDEEGNPYLADLGLAASETELLDEPDGVLGTLHYMSPEQATNRSNRADGRADIYSLGVVFYRMLTGRVPYLARTREEYVRLLQEPNGPKPPRQINPGIPVELERICLRCIETNAKDRYQTAADVCRDVREWEQSQRSRGSLPKQWLRPVLAGAAVALLVPLAYVVYPLIVPHEPRVQDSPADPAPKGPNAVSAVTGQVTKARDALVHPLLFPHDNESSWVPSEAGDSLHVSSTYVSLLGLGRIEGEGTHTISVRVHQLDWPGRVGVFCGYRSDESGSARFELIELEQIAGEFFWRRSQRRILDRDKQLATRLLAQCKGKAPGRKAITLKLQITDSVLSDIRVNGDSLVELLEISPLDNEIVQDATGEFGVYNLRSVATFSNVMVDEQAVRIQKSTADLSHSLD